MQLTVPTDHFSNTTCATVSATVSASIRATDSESISATVSATPLAKSWLIAALFCVLLLAAPAFAAESTGPASDASDEVFTRIVTRAAEGKWKDLPIGELMGKIANELVGTPYVGGVLDRNPNQEECTVDLTSLDCVTFFESTLDFARMLKKGETTPKSLIKEVTFTRYRGGIPKDYTSRLHYTTDWFHDNERKHVIKLLPKLPGSAPFKQKVNFMSTHLQLYPVLKAHPELVSVLKKQEETINSRKLQFVPLDKIAEIEPLLQTGDIVGICTNRPGLDIVHTGLIFRDNSGIAHFMDASSKKSNMKVTIEPGPISGALGWSKNNIGIMVARPLEP